MSEDGHRVKTAIEDQIERLHQIRVMSGFLSDSAIGETSFHSGSYYALNGLQCTQVFASPLTRDDVERINALGHWINQNFIVRVYAIMESNRLTRPAIRQELDGSQELDIVRRLRNQFAHGSGRFDSSESDHQELFDRIVDRFKVATGAYFAARRQFPIPIDVVVVPLARGCQRYALAALPT